MFWLVQLALASALEIFLVGWRGCSLHHYRPSVLSRSKLADLFFSTLAIVGIGDLWVVLTTFGLGYLTGIGANRILTLKFGLPSIETGSIAIDGLIFYLLNSFFFYWNHRLFHTGPFWTLHRFHHSATEMSLFNALRHHPLQQAIERLIMAWPVALTGVRPGIFIVVMALHGFQQLLTHANLPHGWGWFGSWVVQSPLVHRVHHSRESERANRNFGALMIWDHIFGTYAAPTNDICVGIQENSHNHRIFLFDIYKDMIDFIIIFGQIITQKPKLFNISIGARRRIQ